MADLEDGYSRVANELLEEAAKRKFNSTQSSIVFFVLRHTYGFQRKLHEMSVGFVAEGTGIHPDQIRRGLKALIDWKVIRVFEEATFNRPRAIGPNKNCEEWTAPSHRGPDEPEGTKQSPQDEIDPGEGTKQSGGEGTKQSPKERYSFKDNFKDNVVTDIVAYLNERANKKFSSKTKGTVKHINARLGEGRTLDEFKHVIDVKVAQWLHSPKMNKFLRPETLFTPSNFESYLNESFAIATTDGENTSKKTAQGMRNERALKKIREAEERGRTGSTEDILFPAELL